MALLKWVRVIPPIIFITLFFTSCGTRAVDEPNIVLIVVDTLRKDHLGSFGYHRSTSPHLDGLAREAMVFENVLSVSSQTVPAVASLLTGLYPSENGVQYFSEKHSFDGVRHWKEAGPHLDAGLSTLAERLQERGYRTGAVVTNPWLQDKFGFGQGFDEYSFLDCLDISMASDTVCNGADVVVRATEWLRSESRSPFFLYLHFMDVHNPYLKAGITRGVYVTEPGTDRYRNGRVPRLKKNDLEYMIALYDEGIRHVDRVIGGLTREIGKITGNDNTLLIITSDHGDEFYEHGGLGHGTTLYSELVDSFLLVHYPEQVPPGRVDEWVSLVDVFPTVMELVDGSKVEQGSGTSLLPLIMDRSRESDRPSVLFSELGELKAIRQGDWKLVMNVQSGRRQLFDLARDHGERENRKTSDPERVQRLEAELLEFLGSARERAPESAPMPMNEETYQKLKALGYVQ
jgi:arylsulfatase A-like enzyme